MNNASCNSLKSTFVSKDVTVGDGIEPIFHFFLNLEFPRDKNGLYGQWCGSRLFAYRLLTYFPLLNLFAVSAWTPNWKHIYVYTIEARFVIAMDKWLNHIDIISLSTELNVLHSGMGIRHILVYRRVISYNKCSHKLHLKPWLDKTLCKMIEHDHYVDISLFLGVLTVPYYQSYPSNCLLSLEGLWSSCMSHRTWEIMRICMGRMNSIVLFPVLIVMSW